MRCGRRFPGTRYSTRSHESRSRAQRGTGTGTLLLAEGGEEAGEVAIQERGDIETKARELGIRAAHGQAVSIKTQKGKSYRILLRASDGLSIVPDGEVPPRKTG